MNRTKAYFEKRVCRLAGMLKFDDDWAVALHCYTPGDRNLYQIQIVHKVSHDMIMSIPESKSYASEDFDIFLDGIFAAARELGIFWRDD